MMRHLLHLVANQPVRLTLPSLVHYQFLISRTDRVRRSRNVDRMAEIINAEQDSYNQQVQHNPKPTRKCKRKAKQKADKSDKDDADFTGSSSDSDSVSQDDDTDCVEITNMEVCFYPTLICILVSELFSKFAESSLENYSFWEES